jgi:hypothetical protein
LATACQDRPRDAPDRQAPPGCDTASAFSAVAELFLRWDAWHPIDEARIAADLEITPEELNKALAELVLHGLILRNDTDYRITVWLLSSVWGKKGSWTEVQANIAAEPDRSRDADTA